MHFVCNEEDIAINKNKRFMVAGKPVLICNSGGEFSAFIDFCPHAMKSLEGGVIKKNKLYCPIHAAAFSLPSGEVLSAPARRGLTALSLSMDENKLYVSFISMLYKKVKFQDFNAIS